MKGTRSKSRKTQSQFLGEMDQEHMAISDALMAVLSRLPDQKARETAQDVLCGLVKPGPTIWREMLAAIKAVPEPERRKQDPCYVLERAARLFASMLVVVDESSGSDAPVRVSRAAPDAVARRGVVRISRSGR